MTGVLLILAAIAGAAAASTACGANMVFTVRASRDRAPWYRIAIPYVAGSLLGAALVGMLLAAAGAVTRIVVGESPGWRDPAAATLVIGSVLLDDTFERIVIHRPTGLHVADGGGEVRIAGHEATMYAVDPSSTRVAIALSAADGDRLLVFDRTLEASLVRECCGSISGLTWGPGPNDVTYVDAESGDPPRVVIVDIQTSDTDSLTVLNEPHFAAEPSWSHDGRWLAIEAQPTRRLRGMTVFTYDTETGALTLIDPTEEPIPKSAAPRFSPTAPILAYTYSAIGAQASEVRLYDMVSRTKTTAEGRGLNDPRWASDGGTILAVRHRSVCETDLVLIDPTSLETDVVLRSGRHLSPMFLSDGVALVVDRACRDADTIPTEPGELLVLDLADGSVEHVAGHVYSARPVAP